MSPGCHMDLVKEDREDKEDRDDRKDKEDNNIICR